METYTNQKEILLVANSCFFSKNWLKKSETASERNFTQKEKIIDACWNGLVPEMLPEFFDMESDKSLSLWEINDAGAFVDLVFCDCVQAKEKEFSVNPYLFMQVKEYN